jgi:hypothetical protein
MLKEGGEIKIEYKNREQKSVTKFGYHSEEIR